MERTTYGTVYGCQAAVPVMRRQGAGVIINVSSIVGHRSLPGGGAYAATKAAQISLTESLRVELRGHRRARLLGAPDRHRDRVRRGRATASPAGRTAGAVGPQQTAEQVADAIVRCARRPRPEVYPAPRSRARSSWLNAVCAGRSSTGGRAGPRGRRDGCRPMPERVDREALKKEPPRRPVASTRSRGLSRGSPCFIGMVVLEGPMLQKALGAAGVVAALVVLS